MCVQGMVEDILYQRGEEAIQTCQRQDGTVQVVRLGLPTVLVTYLALLLAECTHMLVVFSFVMKLV